MSSKPRIAYTLFVLAIAVLGTVTHLVERYDGRPYEVEQEVREERRGQGHSVVRSPKDGSKIWITMRPGEISSPIWVPLKHCLNYSVPQPEPKQSVSVLYLEDGATTRKAKKITGWQDTYSKNKARSVWFKNEQPDFMVTLVVRKYIPNGRRCGWIYRKPKLQILFP